MEQKKITCIECPKGCLLEIDVENNKLVAIKGHQCSKGEVYGRQEIENPMRILTATVIAEGLSLKLVPVRTDKPIPKDKLLAARYELARLRVNKPVFVGDVIVRNFLGTDAQLIATREVL